LCKTKTRINSKIQGWIIETIQDVQFATTPDTCCQ
jgi:hypothetical protein